MAREIILLAIMEHIYMEVGLCAFVWQKKATYQEKGNHHYYICIVSDGV